MITRLAILAAVLAVAFVSLGNAPAEATGRLTCYPPSGGVTRCVVTFRRMSEDTTGLRYAKLAQQRAERLTGLTYQVDRVNQPYGFYWAGKTPCGLPWRLSEARTAAGSQAELAWTFGGEAEVMLRVCESTALVAESVSLQEERRTCERPLYEGWNVLRWKGKETFSPQDLRAEGNRAMGTGWHSIAQQGHTGAWTVTFRVDPFPGASTKDHVAPGDWVWIFVEHESAYRWSC